ncbi:MAG: hypothetical protein V4864_25980 [Pseudomonadota bacterium]
MPLTLERLRRRGRIAALGGVAAVMALLVWTWTSINPTVTDVAYIESERLPRLELIQHMQVSEMEASMALRNALLLRDPGRTLAELATCERQQAQAAAALRELEQQVAPKNRELLQALRAQHDRLLRVRAAAVQRAREQPGAPPPDGLMVELQGALDGYLGVLQQLRAYERERVLGLVGDALATAEQARLLLALSGVAAALVLLALVRGWRREARGELLRKDQEIRRLHAQRDALVRDVHHRMKNHLQGLLSLIDQQRAAHPLAAPPLDMLQSQVLALVSLHGLQGQQGGEQVDLGTLAERQVPLVQAAFPGARVALAPHGPGALVQGEQAVPAALVVSELIVNAVKHGDGQQAQVRIFRDGGDCCVAVDNRCATPPRFDWAQARGLGTGLELVQALLAGLGRLEQVLAGDTMTMTLRLPCAAPQA